MVVADGKVRRQKVRVGRDDGLHAEILGGLDPKAQVVLKPDASMADGTPERNEGDARHMNWREVTAPTLEFLDKVNSLYGTAFQLGQFAAR